MWVLFLLMTATAYAQQERVSLPRTQLSTEDIIRSIQQQTDYVFAFDRRTFDISRTVRMGTTNLSVRELLDLITAGTDCTWLQSDSYIVIHYRPRQKEPSPEPEFEPRTNDIYRLSDPNVADAFRSREPLPSEPVSAPLSGTSVRQVPSAPLPASYSAWRDADLYAAIRHSLPRGAIKTDLLYGAGTLTPNFGIEWGLNTRSSVEFTGSWNQWNHEGRRNNNKKLNHGIARLEYRRWFCERYNGHFVGAHLFGVKYNVSGYDIPTLFDREFRYQGNAFGAGLTYGYHLPLSGRWGVDFHVGVGVARFDHKRFECVRCGNEVDRPAGFWFGPTRAGIDLVFIL